MKQIAVFCLVASVCLLGATCSRDNSVTDSIPMPELVSPGRIVANSDHLVIVDGANGAKMRIYRLPELDALLQFGERGQGRGQFMTLPGTTVIPYALEEQLLISSFGKVTVCDWRGSFLRETKTPVSTLNYQPFGDGYIGQDFLLEENVGYLTLNQYDNNFGFVKEILRIENCFQSEWGNRILTGRLQYQTYKDRLYVTGATEEFRIEIYDTTGELVCSSDVDYERDPFTTVHDREVHAYYKNHEAYRELYDLLATQFVNPEKLPAIKEFVVTGDQIYVWTFRVTRGLRELYVLSIGGRLEAVLQVPAGGHNILASGLCTVVDGRHYQLVTNSLGTDWLMLVTQID